MFIIAMCYTKMADAGKLLNLLVNCINCNV